MDGWMRRGRGGVDEAGWREKLPTGFISMWPLPQEHTLTHNLKFLSYFSLYFSLLTRCIFCNLNIRWKKIQAFIGWCIRLLRTFRHIDIINEIMYSVMNYTAPNEKHKADFPSTPLIFTVNRSLPVDPLWEQVESRRVQLLADLQEEIYIDGDPCGTGIARYLQYDVQRVHRYEDKNHSKQWFAIYTSPWLIYTLFQRHYYLCVSAVSNDYCCFCVDNTQWSWFGSVSLISGAV